MAIQLPRLDDRTYDQLVETLRRQIPAQEEWTDHNPSDPGIMLLELLSWLSEMVLYRMDRVPEAHTSRFLDFLVEPAQPVTITATFRVTFPAAAPPGTSLVVPAGTLLATSYAAGRRFVFETFRSLTLRRPPTGPPVAERSTTARAVLVVFNESLGVSDGSPHQVFQLRPPRQALGLAADAPAPILTDFVHATATYQPNPRVQVGAAEWTPVPSLLTAASHVSAAGAGQRYQVDANAGTIRFGDGAFGAIPPAGALVECIRYTILDAPAEALRVREGDVTQILNASVPPGTTLEVIDNSDAEGGTGFFPAAQRAELGLREFRAPYRLVTERDFERAVLLDFNAFQQLAASTPAILRASIAIDRRPAKSSGTGVLIESPSSVTLVLLAGAPQFDESQFRDESIPATAKQAMVGIPEALWRRIERFLDPRRLITTRLYRHTPELKPFTITASVVVAGDRNTVELHAELRRRLYGFLSLVHGDVHGRGWRLGRNVYRSQLFRLLEDVPGVDHVASLVLSAADADGNVAIAPHELPLLQGLTLTVVRE